MKDSYKSVIVSLERTTKAEMKCKSLMTTVNIGHEVQAIPNVLREEI